MEFNISKKEKRKKEKKLNKPQKLIGCIILIKQETTEDTDKTEAEEENKKQTCGIGLNQKRAE